MKTKHHTYKFTDRQKEIINGCLLGDGSLSKPSSSTANSSFCSTHCNAQLGLLNWLKNHLNPLYCRMSIKLNDVSRLNKSNIEDIRIYHNLNTCVHQYFTDLEKKWYKRDFNGNYCYKLIGKQLTRIKIVPNDLILTRESITAWFWDDGSLSPEDRTAIFYTDSFTLQECNYLIDQLSKFNIQSYTSKRAYKENVYSIKIRSHSFLDFVNLINHDVPACMKYKVDLSKYPERCRKLPSNKTVLDIIQQLKEGKPQNLIAKELNISEYTVTNIYRGKRHQKLSGFEKLDKKQIAYHNTNVTGIPGVRKIKNGYVVRIGIGKPSNNGFRVYLGQFENLDQAIKIRNIAENLRKQGIKDIEIYKSIKSNLNQTKPASSEESENIPCD